MKRSSVILVIGLAACSHDVGKARGRGQGMDGAKDGTTAQSGADDVGQAAQDVRGSSGPHGTQTGECVVNWQAGSIICKNQGAESSCWTKYRGQYATLDEAKIDCERTYGVGKGSGAESCASCRWVSGEGP